MQTLERARSHKWETISRIAIMFLLCLAGGLVTSPSASAEEIALKDGTKIVGHVTGITSDKIEVETPKGRIQLNRSKVTAINFVENSSRETPEIDAHERDFPAIDETLSGTQYVNRTGNFSLTLPSGWGINQDLLHSSSSLAGLTSDDKKLFALVIQEEYPGSLGSYKDLTVLHVQRTLDHFEELSESNATIDGKAAVLVFYRGVVTESNDLPVEFLSAIINSGNHFIKITTWCVEPLFHDMQATFEKIVSSYHSLSPVTSDSH